MQVIGTPPSRRLGLAGNIKNGLAVPVLSDRALFDLVLGAHTEFAAFMASATAYPLPDADNLAHVLRYYKLSQQDSGYSDSDLRADYLFYVKNYILGLLKQEGADADHLAEAEAAVSDVTISVSEFAKANGWPRFQPGDDDPLLVLANKPFRTFITTSPFTFIESALIKAGKTPRTIVCLWRTALENKLQSEPEARIEDGYVHSPEEPLVYHLFGLDKYPDTLVLTEDDHLDFLVNVSRYRGDDSRDRIHALARRALNSDLLLLGFTLESWAFRTVYGGLVRPADDMQAGNNGLCCMQLDDSDAERSQFKDLLQREAETYVKREVRFEVFWGDLKSYAATIR